MPFASDPSKSGRRLALPKFGSRLVRRLRRRNTPTPAPGRVVVRLSGEIGTRNALRTGQRLQQALAPGPAVLEVDLKRVTRITGDGSFAFFTALKATAPSGTRLVLTHVSPQALGTLSQLGLARVLEMYEGDDPAH